jgi:hypothetical protein
MALQPKTQPSSGILLLLSFTAKKIQKHAHPAWSELLDSKFTLKYTDHYIFDPYSRVSQPGACYYVLCSPHTSL